jgi:hypothetical protein
VLPTHLLPSVGYPTREGPFDTPQLRALASTCCLGWPVAPGLGQSMHGTFDHDFEPQSSLPPSSGKGIFDHLLPLRTRMFRTMSGTDSSRQTPIPVNLRFGLSALPFTALQLRRGATASWKNDRISVCDRDRFFMLRRLPKNQHSIASDGVNLCCISGRLKLHRVCRTPPQTLEGHLPADGDVQSTGSEEPSVPRYACLAAGHDPSQLTSPSRGRTVTRHGNGGEKQTCHSGAPLES